MEFKQSNKNVQQKENVHGKHQSRGTFNNDNVQDAKPTICADNVKEEQVCTSIESNILLKAIPQLNSLFTIKRKIGEGAFSSVYLACVKSCEGVSEEYVALKHLIPTSHPNRMLIELQCLQKLGGRNNIIKLLTCVRNGSNVILVMPYFPHDQFSMCVGKLELCEIKEYMKNLLLALKEVHTNGIIHRDVKPSNFLYNRRFKRYTLCDFGLAQYASKCKPTASHRPSKHTIKGAEESATSQPQEDQHVVIENHIIEPKLGPAFFKLLPPTSGSSSHVTSNLQLSVFGSKPTLSNCSENVTENVCYCQGHAQVCTLCLNKPVQVAARAGTPGYRPPEVLLKHPFQTTAVDIWSAGVILLCFLSGHTSFFHSNDDLASLAEIMTLFGSGPVKECGRQFGKTLICRPEMPPLYLDLTCEQLRKGFGHNNPINDKDLTSAYDLLKKMLVLNPSQRISAQQALLHAFFL